jgi:CRISPR-associated protein Cas1
VKSGNLQILPKVSDRLSYLYVEYARIDKEHKAIAVHDDFGTSSVPCAGITLLMLGPGVSITHAAIMVLANCGCMVAWVGEQAVRFYASGTGVTRSAANIQKQATYWADVRKMYEMRFDFVFDQNLSLQQIRGHEGVRVRDSYRKLSEEYGVEMSRRDYKTVSWSQTDPINKAISVANSCLYGVCHAAIVAAGYSPALGFIHTGKQLSFVYDIADLYKTDISLVAAFKTVASGINELERRTRIACRDEFYQSKLLKRIIKDIHTLFDLELDDNVDDGYDVDQSAPGDLWESSGKHIKGGMQHGFD